MSINNQEYHARYIVRQSPDEFNEWVAPSRPLTVMKRNSSCALTAEMMFKANLAAVLLTAGVFLFRPRRSRMMVRADSRLIPKEYQRLLLLGQTPNTRIVVLQPFLSFFRTLLMSLPHGTVRCQFQLTQESGYRRFAHLDFKTLKDDLPNHLIKS